ncbi:hypothetical protein A2801_02645 [Candidatus Woesebacteria bacterium RIFCSPHIGHO2_01_FULL_41_10]|uniref:Uncharacterized protein n=1 Tax=Candidatus Woesebacteria bacterium RIFCSPHIGHO2_01_FULL_41_10 TaxID=1802500 RepID=A0A1F7YPG4_9BACT|nr:MAG: hypothetical protein A2801_02645 [Candidatus Woesebacteria bacterium RIFCSPHIGHO2_01_FULL_41_10]
MSNSKLDVLYRGQSFASTLCRALGRGAFIVLMQVNEDGEGFVSIGDWAGEKPSVPSRAPFVANAKAAELFYAGKAVGLCTTPIISFEMGLGWMGGARDTRLIVGVSKWAEEHDLLLAVLTLYAMQHETQLHHVGIRFPSEVSMRLASQGIKASPLEVPAADHMRIYHWMPSWHLATNGYYLETQYFPAGPQTEAYHWDLVTEDPVQLLEYVGSAFSITPELFDDSGANDPIGMIWIPDKEGNMMGVMARKDWWYVEQG